MTGSHLVRESVNPRRLESAPVIAARREHDGGRGIAQALDELQRLSVLRDVPDLKRNTPLFEALDRELTRLASGIRENNDQGGLQSENGVSSILPVKGTDD